MTLIVDLFPRVQVFYFYLVYSSAKIFGFYDLEYIAVLLPHK